MNVTFAGFAGEPESWLGPDGTNVEGTANLAAFQKQLGREDIALTHTIIHPTIDRPTDGTFTDHAVPLPQVGETEDATIVLVARILATLAPFSAQLAAYPDFPLPDTGKTPCRDRLG